MQSFCLSLILTASLVWATPAPVTEIARNVLAPAVCLPPGCASLGVSTLIPCIWNFNDETMTKVL